MNIKAIIFDVYGTLLDVYSIKELLEKKFQGMGVTIAEIWRDKQIEYTRLRSMSNMYIPFWNLTEDALVFTFRKLNLNLSFEDKRQIMDQYAVLDPFSENISVIKELKKYNLKLGVLSNGNMEMLEKAFKVSGMQEYLDFLLSVDSVKKYKTFHEAYKLGIDKLNIKSEKILFVSSNCWDICGAAWFGYKTFWVNRYNSPMEELGVKPDAEGTNLNELLNFLKK